MAPKKQQPRLTLEELDQLTWGEISSMDIKELRIAVYSAQRAVNNRLKNLDRYTSGEGYAQKWLESSGGKISAKGKNVNQLRSELKRAKMFLNMKSSTVGGVRKIEADYTKRYEGYGSYAKSGPSMDEFWRAYGLLKNNDKALFNAYGSAAIQEALDKVLTDETSFRKKTGSQRSKYRAMAVKDKLSERDKGIIGTLSGNVEAEILRKRREVEDEIRKATNQHFVVKS